MLIGASEIEATSFPGIQFALPMAAPEEDFYNLDASTFQEPLVKLAEVLAQKVKREAPRLLAAPGFVSVDLHVLIRQAMYTYNTLFYLNADERRKTDPFWRTAYSVVTLPLIRNMIDCLYNITAILQDPGVNGPWFRRSGYKKALAAFDEEEARYGGRPEWAEWIKKRARWAGLSDSCSGSRDARCSEFGPVANVGKVR